MSSDHRAGDDSAALLLTHAPPGGASGSGVRAAQTRRTLESLFDRVDVVSLARPGDEHLAEDGVQLVPRVSVDGRRAYLGSLLRGGSAFAGAHSARIEDRIDLLTAQGTLASQYQLVLPHFAIMAGAALRVRAKHRVIDLDMSVAGDTGRQQGTAGSRAGRVLQRADASATRRREHTLCRAHEIVVVATDEEATDMARFHPRVEVVPNTAPDPGLATRPFDERAEVLFVGTLDVQANIEGVLFLCREVVPRLRERVADLQVRVVGRSPTAEVVRVCDEAQVTLTPNAPSLAEHYGQARCVVAPLWSGGGSRIKLIEAMSYGSAIVASGVAMLGVALQDGTSALHAETPEEFAAALERCLTDPALCTALAQAGRRGYDEHHHPSAIGRRMAAVLAPTVS